MHGSPTWHGVLPVSVLSLRWNSGSLPGGLDGGIPAAVQGDEGMNGKGGNSLFGERKEVNHFRQQTAPTGRRQLPEVGELIEG